MKLSPMGQFTWLVFFSYNPFFSAQFLFPNSIFTFFGGQILFHFVFGPPLNQSFFEEAPTYTQPTYHPSSYQPTSFLHAIDPSPPCHLRSLLVFANVLLAIAIAITRGA